MTANQPASSRQDRPADQHKQGVAAFFSETAEYWNDLYSAHNLFERAAVVARQDEVLRMISSWLSPSDGTILEAGCGAGQLAQRLTGSGYSTIGLDIARPMAQATRERLGRERRFLGCVIGDIEHLPFKSGCFAAVSSVGVLQYLTDDKQCIQEFCRAVKESGKVVITLPNLSRVSSFLDPVYIVRLIELIICHARRAIGREPQRFTSQDYHSNRNFGSRRYTFRQLDGVFQHFGFSHLEAAAVGFGPFTFFRLQIFSPQLSLKISRFLENASQRPGLGWLECFGNRWVHCYGADQTEKRDRD